MKLTKTLLISPLVAATLVGGAFAATPAKTTDTSTSTSTSNIDNTSYSMGYTMGQALENQLSQNKITLNDNQIIVGMKDGIGAKNPRLTQTQMQSAILELQKQVQKAASSKK